MITLPPEIKDLNPNRGTSPNGPAIPAPAADLAITRAFCRAALDPQRCHAVRILKASLVGDHYRNEPIYPKTYEGYYTDHARIARVAAACQGVNAYLILNPTPLDLLGQSPNVLRVVGKGQGLGDDHISRLRFLTVDLDSHRFGDGRRLPNTINATDAEHACSLRLRDQILATWPELLGNMITGSSGNGAYLHLRVDMENDPANRKVFSDANALLRRIFNPAAIGAEIDPSTTNPSRLVPLPGSCKCKSVHTPERPCRLVTVENAGTIPDVLDLSGWLAANADRPSEPPTSPPTIVDLGRDPVGPVHVPAADATSERGPILRRATAYLAAMAPAVSGERGHDHTFDAACSMVLGFALTAEEAFPLLAAWNQTCQPPWTDAELTHKLEDAEKKPGPRGYLLDAPRPGGPGPGSAMATQMDESAASPAPVTVDDGPKPEVRPIDFDLAHYDRTDSGNARRMVARYGRDLRYCHPWSKWLTWEESEGRWRLDDRGRVARLADLTAHAIGWESAAYWPDKAEVANHRKFGLATQSRKFQEAMIALARSRVGIPVLPQELDFDPWLLNCLNGTVDLRSGTLRPHDRQDMVTKTTGIAFDPGARCPLWEQTLSLFLREDAELIDYLGRIAGSALTGVVRDHALFLAIGDGANGKSTVLGALLGILGEYGLQAAPDLLLARAGEVHPTGLADLAGRRLVIASETNSDRRLDEATVKLLTGGDRVRARRMREDYWEYVPSHKLILATNHEPEIRGTDHGIWRRIRRIPFGVTLPTDRIDPDMGERLKGEYPGILAWAVRGCARWQRHGLGQPRGVVEATDAYREDQDTVGQFLAEYTQYLEGYRERANRLYSLYRAWCEVNHMPAQSSTAFGRTLGRKGIPKIKSNGIHYVGIILIKSS